MKIILTRDELRVLVKAMDVEIEVGDAVPTKPKEEPKPELKPEPKKEEPKKKPNSKIDHGKIVACYKGGRSISWIADDMKIAYQTVANHLKKEGLI